MKKKTFWKVLALVLVLTLSLGIFAACGKDKGGGSDKTDEGGGGDDVKPIVSTKASRQDAFLDTLFNSANELASGANISTDEGNNISFNIGATVKIKLDNETLPISISAKGFLDREHIDSAQTTNDFVIDKKLAPFFAKEVNDGDGREPYDKDGVYSENAIYYGTWYTISDGNSTVIDINIEIAGVKSFGIYYDAAVSQSMTYLTLGGNQYDVDLSKLVNTFGDWSKSAVYNVFEVIIQSDIVKSVVQAFSGTDFDINNVLSGLITKLLAGKLQGKSIYELIKSSDLQVMGKSISEIIFGLFGGEEAAKTNLGTVINVLGLLKSVKTTMLADPSWSYKNASGGWTTAKQNEYDTKIGTNLNQALKASINLDINLLGMKVLDMTVFNEGKIALGFVKEAGANGSTGALDEFSIKLLLTDILAADGSRKDFGLEVIIDELDFSSEKAEDITKTTEELDRYGAFYFDMGADVAIDSNTLQMIFGNAMTEYTVKVIDKTAAQADENLNYAFSIDRVNKIITIPDSFKLSISGALDLATSADTAIVLTLGYKDESNADVVIAKAQVFGKEGLEAGDYALVVEAKADKDILTDIMSVIMELSDGNTIGKNNFGYDQILGVWGFWNGAGTYSAEGIASTVKGENFDNSLIYYSLSENVYTRITDNAAIATGTTVYYVAGNAGVITSDGQVYSRLYKTGENYSLKGISNAMNSFIGTGELRMENVALYDLIQVLTSNSGTIFLNYTEATDNQAKAASEISTLAWVIGALLQSDRSAGAVTILANLFDYENGSLIIGGEDALANIFNNVLFLLDSDTTDIVSSIYSMLGYFVDLKVGGNTDILTLYKLIESRIYALNSGFNIGEYGFYLRLAAAGANTADALVTEWKTASADRKAAIVNELSDMGYALVATDATASDAVLYPSNLFKLILADAGSKYAAFTTSTPTTDLGDGFTLVELSGENLAGVTAQNFNNRVTGKYYQVISKSIAELKTAYEAESSYDNAVLLLRRGVVATVKNESVVYYDVFMDEGILSNADASIEIYTEKDGNNVMTKGGVKISANYDGSDIMIDMYMNFVDASTYETEGALDLVKVGVEKTGFLSDGCGVITLDIVG